MRRALYLLAGWAALGLGAAGILLPILPTVPFWILAAWFFARSDPRLEKWLLDHPRAGTHLRAWRERGAIHRRGKFAASVALALSSLVGLAALPLPLSLVPLLACAATALFIWTRPG